jgi:hypothetical protein
MVNQRNSNETVRRCRDLTFNHDSTVGKSLVAAAHDDMNKNQIGKQSQDAESNVLSIHGKTCQNPEIVQTRMSEESNSFLCLNIRNDFKDLIEEKVLFVEETVNQPNSKKIVQRCGKLTFDHDSTVDESLVAAEHNNMNKNHIGKQS